MTSLNCSYLLFHKMLLKSFKKTQKAFLYLDKPFKIRTKSTERCDRFSSVTCELDSKATLRTLRRCGNSTLSHNQDRPRPARVQGLDSGCCPAPCDPPQLRDTRRPSPEGAEWGHPEPPAQLRYFVTPWNRSRTLPAGVRILEPISNVEYF